MSGRIPFPSLQEERFSNGSKLIVARRAGVPLAAVRLVLSIGAALDPQNAHGLSHLVALTSRRGSRKRSGRQIDEAVESLGAELGAASDEDASYYGLSAPAEHLPRLLDLVMEVATEPSFPADELTRLKRRELAGLVHLLDDPAAVADRALIHAVYGSHPYGHPLEGRREQLRRITRSMAVEFHKKWYGPAVATLVVVGDVDPERTLTLARRRIGRWHPDAKPPPPLPPAEPVARKVLVMDKPDLTQTQIRIGVPAYPRRCPSYFAAVVANAAFGGGFTSRLVEAVRVNRGLSYGVRSRFAMGRAAGMFYVSSFTKNESVAELVQVLLDEGQRFADEGPNAEELSRAQAWLGGLYPLSLETHDQVAEKVADMQLYGLDLEEVTSYRERVRAVTAEECRAVARESFPLERGAVVAVGPAKVVARELERFGPVTVIPVKKAI